MNSLRTRLLISLATLLGLLLLVVSMLQWRAAHEFADEVIYRQNRSIAMYVAERLATEGQQAFDRQLMQRIASHAMTLNPSATVHLIDAAGSVQWPTSPPGGNFRMPVATLHRLFALAQEDRPVYGPVPGSTDQSQLISIAEMKLPDRVLGYVYVTLSGVQSDPWSASLSQGFALRAGYQQLLVLAIVALLAAFALTRTLTRPLQQLHDKVVQTGQQLGLQSTDPGSGRCKDVATISQVFTALAQTVQEQVKQLRQTDSLRRELLAHISHDLRTPLTAMRGYLETLAIKGNSLAPRDRERFIGTAVRHSERLNKIVDRLFLLARLDAATLALNPEPVALGDMAQDLISKWQVSAESAGVNLQLELESVPSMVYADIGLLETVLENLLENALRHTAPGGAITLAVRGRPESVTICISDNGSGMSAQLLAAARATFVIGPGGRSGIGLAIVRRVLALHGTCLDLSSQVGRGTTAKFTLKTCGRDDSVIQQNAFSIDAA
jgi:two-component system, OmpR family, sensor kinase